MTEEERFQVRRECRIETLSQLASLARAGIELTAEALDELRVECEQATTLVSEIQFT